jgi:hypothetical protein
MPHNTRKKKESTMTTISFSDKINELSAIYDIVENEGVKFEAQSFNDWYEWFGGVCKTADLSKTGGFEFTLDGKAVIDKAYDSFLALIDVSDDITFAYQEDYPFNEFVKPEAVIYV